MQKLLSACEIDDLSWAWTILEKAWLKPTFCIKILISNKKVLFSLNSLALMLYK